MIITNFESSTTKGAVDYVLSDKNHRKENRENKPEILKGDEFLTRQAGEQANKFSNKTTSGVISFAKNEKPTKQQMLSVVENYEKTFLSNMRDRVAPLYVLHEEKKGVHIHVIIPNIDLKTGKNYNPFPPGRQTKNLIKAFTSLENDRLGFEQVNTYKSQKSKTQQKANAHKNDNNNFFKEVFNNAKDKNQLENYCVDLVKNGEIKNRSELIELLKSVGFEFSRVGEDYISIKNDGGKNWRFKGGIFSNDTVYKAEQKEQTEEIKTEVFDTEKAKNYVNSVIEKRDTYNLQRFFIKEDLDNIVNKVNIPQIDTYNNNVDISNIQKIDISENAQHFENYFQQSQQSQSTKNNETSNNESSDDGFSGNYSGDSGLNNAIVAVSIALTVYTSAKTPEARARAFIAFVKACANLSAVQDKELERRALNSENNQKKILSGRIKI